MQMTKYLNVDHVDVYARHVQQRLGYRRTSMRMSIGMSMNWESRPVLGCFVTGFFGRASESAWWDVLARLRDDVRLAFSLPLQGKLVVADGIMSAMVVEAEMFWWVDHASI